MDDNYNYDNYYEPQRSTFVTVVGVIFIILAVLSLLNVLAQTILLPTLFHNEEVTQRIQEQIDEGTMPTVVGYMYTHRNIFMAVSLVIAVVSLISSIGLLMRKNWARIMFIVLMSYRIASSIFGIGLQLFVTPTLPNNVPQSSAQFMTTIMIVARVFSFLLAAGFCVLYGWIISKLLSERIRREFLPQAQPEEIYDNGTTPHQE